MGETEKKEQVTSPPEEEEQGKEPSDVSEAVEMFQKEQAEKPSEESTEKITEESPAEKETEEAEEEDEEVEEEEEDESPELSPELTKLDEHLKENPLLIEVDGKEVEVNSAEKLKTYAQFGYKGYDRQGELKKKEEELQKGADQLHKILDGIETAKKEGRLIIKPYKSSEQPSEEEKAEEEEEELYADPELKKVQKENKELKNRLTRLETDYIDDKIEYAYKKLNEEIEKLRPKFPLYSRNELYHLLAEKDENDRPKYTLEEAMKKSDADAQKRFQVFLKNNPDYNKKTEEEKKQIIAEFQAAEKKRTEAPVSSPSETPAGGAPTQEEEGEPQTAQEGYEAFLKQKKVEMEAGKKS